MRPNHTLRESLSLPLLLLSLLGLQFCAWPSVQAARQSTPQAHAQQQNTAAQKPQAVTTLEEGKTVEREFSDGQKHSYQITLTKGQYVRVEIKQLSIRVRVTIEQPDGRIIPLIDLPLRRKEFSVERVAESSGIYRLDIYAGTKTPTGRYEIRVAELHPATENEQALQQAREFFDRFIGLQRSGKVVEARPFEIRALEIRERVLGPEGLLVAETLEFLGNNYNLTGDYAIGEPLLQRALKIKEKVLGPDHPAVAEALRGLGIYYYEKGDYFKAEEVHKKALAIFDRAQLTESTEIASLLSALGDIYYERGDYKIADQYFQQSRVMLEKLFGPDHFHLGAAFTSLGLVAYDAGDYAKAEAMFQRALFLSEKWLGPDSLYVTSCRNHLAMVFTTTREYGKAEAVYLQALATHEKKYAMSHPDVQETLLGLARLYAAQGMLSKAVEFQSRATAIEERSIELNLFAGSEREKLAFLANLSSAGSRSISLHTLFAPGDPAARDLAATTILQRKGRVQDAMADNMAALRRRFGAEDRALLDDLNNTTSQLARLTLNGPQRMTLPEHQTQIKSLEEQRDKLEAEISRRSTGYFERSQPVTLAAVKAVIPGDAALVEFAAYRPWHLRAGNTKDMYGEPCYVVYVIRNQGEVRWAQLGAQKEIDARVDSLRQALRDPQRKDVQQLARSVDELVMQPVRDLTGDATQLLISPDGELNLIPFAALVDEHGRYLIERYAASYLTSGRDLLRMQVPRKSTSEPVIIANPLFGESTPEFLAKANAMSHGMPGRIRRSVASGRDVSEVYFAPLAGTAKEAQSIQTVFPKADLLTGARATESSLKRVSAPRLLHIATHGFFLSEAEPDPGVQLARPTGVSVAPGPAQTRGINTNARIQNPLLRSGLALAGANMRRGAIGNDDDGIMTALEASGLNLWGTKLVVLSACDTGLGEVRNGEGVYGLRRAFVLAGAESLVMSLWPISDYSTRTLMTSYYKNLKQGLGRGESLRQVQLDLLRRNKQLHPFYWANFIQSGAWTSLDGERTRSSH